MDAPKNAALLLSLIAPLFAYLTNEEYSDVRQNPDWANVVAAGAALEASEGEAVREALELPAWSVRSAFQNDVLVSGLPLAAMPVESLYKAWSTQRGGELSASRGLYMGDPARHLSVVYEQLALEIPPAFASMPDHLTLELELLSLLLEAGNSEAARSVVADHLDWLAAYHDELVQRSAMVAANEFLHHERQRNLLAGLRFMQALVKVTDRLVHEAVGVAAPEPIAATV